MKKATFTMRDGTKKDFDYDENAPCIVCGLPVTEASTSGTNLCPWCDCGVHRDGNKWTLTETLINLKKWNKHVAECREE